jgi:hypothetical protein
MQDVEYGTVQRIDDNEWLSFYGHHDLSSSNIFLPRN